METEASRRTVGNEERPAAVAAGGAPRRQGWVPGSELLRAWLLALVLGIVAGVLVPATAGATLRVLVGWNTLVMAAVVAQWRIILRSDPERCRLRAVDDDPGAVGILIVSVIASLTSLFAAVVILADPGRHAGATFSGLLSGLVILAVAGGWMLMHSAFALHYARLYYADEPEGSGLAFVGGPPDDLDFAYFAFGVGMTFQVADVAVTSRLIRRVVLLHAILSFAYNTAILALMINLIAGHL